MICNVAIPQRKQRFTTLNQLDLWKCSISLCLESFLADFKRKLNNVKRPWGRGHGKILVMLCCTLIEMPVLLLRVWRRLKLKSKSQLNSLTIHNNGIFIYVQQSVSFHAFEATTNYFQIACNQQQFHWIISCDKSSIVNNFPFNNFQSIERQFSRTFIRIKQISHFDLFASLQFRWML